LKSASDRVIQSSLGSDACYVIDFANAFFGFIDAMKVADCHIANGIVRYALVVTGGPSLKVLRAAVDVLKRVSILRHSVLSMVCCLLGVPVGRYY
jgi:3-oxoacyl-[acyl-carrier-protein] synthase III